MQDFCTYFTHILHIFQLFTSSVRKVLRHIRHMEMLRRQTCHYYPNLDVGPLYLGQIIFADFHYLATCGKYFLSPVCTAHICHNRHNQIFFSKKLSTFSKIVTLSTASQIQFTNIPNTAYKISNMPSKIPNAPNVN